MTLANLRSINLILCVIGIAVFAALLAYISIAPKDFDQRTRDFAIGLVQQKTQAALRTMATSDEAERIADFAGIFSQRLEGEIGALQDSIDAGLPELIAEILAAACRLDCERKAVAEAMITSGFESLLARNSGALERARRMVVGEYDRIMGELRRDLTIFAGSTLAAFLAAAALAIFKGRASAHLLPISIVLSAATLISIVWYVFGQDWVLTIIRSDYWGWSYAALMAAISALLADIAVNRARMTTHLMNFLGGSTGSFHLSPC